MKTILAIAVCAVLAGCAQPEPQPALPQDRCSAAQRVLASPYATVGQQMLAMEVLKSHCIGPAQEQRIRILQ